MEKMKGKNNGGSQLMTQDLDPMGSPHLEEELVGGDCRSRSPLPNPSKRCKNHRREGRGSKLKGDNNGGERKLKKPKNNLENRWGRIPFYRQPKIWPFGAKTCSPVKVGVGAG